MRRTNRIVPTYTGDVSGACSALFELGGMVVIHDPSGCNSTYNTHDETRWYDHDSLIFITGLTERDAILGNDDKLVEDVVAAARQLRPRFIALCNSPIPFISGTDFAAICRLVERACDIPCFYVRTNGMHDYVTGASNAWVALARRFVAPGARREGTVNILGATPLDLGVAGSDAPLRAFVDEAGLQTLSCWAMGSTLDDLSRAAQAQVSLVVSASGLGIARWLYEQAQVPYVVGFPVAGFSPTLADCLRRAARTGRCLWPAPDGHGGTGAVSCAFVGEPVLSASLAAAAEQEMGLAARVVCPLEVPQELLGAVDLRVEGEEGVAEALAGVRTVVADELYAPIVAESVRHVALPHQALSGRNGWKTAVEPTTLDVRELLG